jgi:hypothetical protein
VNYSVADRNRDEHVYVKPGETILLFTAGSDTGGRTTQAQLLVHDQSQQIKADPVQREE